LRYSPPQRKTVLALEDLLLVRSCALGFQQQHQNRATLRSLLLPVRAQMMTMALHSPSSAAKAHRQRWRKRQQA
jgi:hypothetical protein